MNQNLQQTSDYLSVEKPNLFLSVDLQENYTTSTPSWFEKKTFAGNMLRNWKEIRVRAIIAQKEEIKENSCVTKPKLVEAKPPGNISMVKASMPLESVVSPVQKVFPSVTPIAPPSLNNQENAEKNIALFFFENKLDFSVARSSSYQLMIDAVAKCGPGFTGPSAEILKTIWLERIKSEVSLQLKDVEKEWTTTGCTIIADTWTDNKSRALINFLVSSPSRTFFHKSVDASSYFKNTKCLNDLFDSVIQDFGPENVVQIIMDSSFNYTGIANHIAHNYRTIFVSHCASQCLNLILEEISKYTGAQELIKTGITKPISHFLSLQSLLKQRSRLKVMFNSPEYSTNSSYTNKPQSITCIAIVEDNDFWRAVEESVAISEPFLKVLREVSAGKPAVGSIYELMTRAKESIRTYYIMDENKCKTFLDIVDRKWREQLHSPLHAAAAFLNPSIQYNPEMKFIPAMKEDLYKVLEILLPMPDMRRDITNQICTFTKVRGMFACNLAKEARDTVPPGLWWEQYGDSAPVLQRVAIRILSQMRTKSLEADPIQFDDIDMTSEWVEESDNPSPTQWLDRFGTALEGSDLNTRQFNAAIFGASDHIFNL
ncbi:hypothetical protein CMV_013081 [Castanea mollissima]|uniref:DUF659 domain-containing protein n=1 Tax=Castanea mollissima TaxID=60419 RepID=A0A8J4RED9_9ROSI|nr:hypothetical protein CMV_013081 [Castanea mollissima]